MTYFGIQMSKVGQQIHVGLLDPEGKRYLGGEDIIDLDGDQDEGREIGDLMPGMARYLGHLRHEDCRDEVLGVVGDYVIEHFEGSLEITYTNGEVFRLRAERFATVEEAAQAHEAQTEYTVAARRDGTVVAVSDVFGTRDQAELELTKLATDDYYRDQAPFIAERRRPAWKPVETLTSVE